MHVRPTTRGHRRRQRRGYRRSCSIELEGVQVSYPITHDHRWLAAQRHRHRRRLGDREVGIAERSGGPGLGNGRGTRNIPHDHRMPERSADGSTSGAGGASHHQAGGDDRRPQEEGEHGAEAWANHQFSAHALVKPYGVQALASSRAHSRHPDAGPGMAQIEKNVGGSRWILHMRCCCPTSISLKNCSINASPICRCGHCARCATVEGHDDRTTWIAPSSAALVDTSSPSPPLTWPSVPPAGVEPAT